MAQDFHNVSGQNIRGKTAVQLVQPPDVKPANNKLKPFLPTEEFAHRIVLDKTQTVADPDNVPSNLQ